MNDTATDTSAAQEYAVVFLGGMEECKMALQMLDDAGIVCAFLDAERARPDLRNRGYYLVTVAPGDYDRARAALDARMQRDVPAPGAGAEAERCPACGAALPAHCAACPDCGLTFDV